MIIPAQLLIFTIPPLVYIAVRRSSGESWVQALTDIGWHGCSLKYYFLGLSAVAVLMALGWMALQVVPPAILGSQYLTTAYYATWRRSLQSFILASLREAIGIALGEEIFFRGLLAGWLLRKFGFTTGNAVQSLAFMLAHVPLLLVSSRLWPLLIVDFVAGWLLGWLRNRSGSVFPGILVHSLTNAWSAFMVMK